MMPPEDLSLTPMQGQYPPAGAGLNPELGGDVLPLEAMLGEPEIENPVPTRLPTEIDWTVRLPDEARQRLGRRLCAEIQAYETARSRRKDNVRSWRRDFELLEADHEQPWENAAATRAPYSALAVLNHAARLNGQIVQANPPFTGRARDAAAVDAVSAVEDVIESLLEECFWADLADEVHKELPLSGNCAVGTEWQIRHRRRPVPLGDMDHQRAVTLLEGGADPEAALTQAVRVDARGKAKLSIDFENVVEKDGLRMWMIPYEDLVLLPVAARSRDQLWGIGEYVRLRGSELKAGAKAGRYLKGPVMDLLKGLSDDPRTDDDFDQWEEITGITVASNVTDHEDEDAFFREYECVELDYYGDLNEDGFDEWYLLTLNLERESLIRVQYNPAEHGMPTRELFGYMRRPKQLLAASVAERLAGLQDTANLLLCGVLDLMDILKGNSSSALYDFRTGIKPGQWKSKIGEWKYVNSIEGIREYPGTQMIPAAIEQLMNMLGVLKQWCDLLSAVNNNTLGQAGGDDTTATEARLAAGQNSELFGDYAMWVGQSWSRVIDRGRLLAAQYGEGGRVKYRVSAQSGTMIQLQQTDPLTGQPQAVEQPGRMVWQVDPMSGAPVRVPMSGDSAFGEIPADMLRVGVDLVPTALGQVPTREGKIQRDLFVYKMAMENPVIAQMQNVLTEMFGIVMRDAQFPQRDRLAQMIQQNLQQLQVAQATMQAAEQEAQAVEGQKVAADGARADKALALKEQGQQFQQQHAASQQALQKDVQGRRADDAAVQGMLNFALKAYQSGGPQTAGPGKSRGGGKGRR